MHQFFTLAILNVFLKLILVEILKSLSNDFVQALFLTKYMIEHLRTIAAETILHLCLFCLIVPWAADHLALKVIKLIWVEYRLLI
jgi:hypothetical protein